MSSSEPDPDEPRTAAAPPAIPNTHTTRRRAESWIERHKVSLAGVFTIGFAGGFAGPSAWDWYLRQDITPGHGTIIGGFFVVTAAAIAYTGTHLTRTSTERIAIAKNDLDKTNAENAHNLTDIQELRRRFVTTTAQFADPSPEVRLAGVYALEALTNDWIDRKSTTDAQTCINYLCGYLTRPYNPPTRDPHLRQTVVTPDIGTHVQRTYLHPHDDLNVRQAITRTIAKHLQPGNRHTWSDYDYDLTGAYFRDATFSGCHFRGKTNLTATHFDGDHTSFDSAEFHSERTDFRFAQFRSKSASFDDAKFYGGLATFGNAQFHGGTSFDDAQFHCRRTTFAAVLFRGDFTSFERAEFWGNMTHFGFARFHSERTSFEETQFRSSSTSFIRMEFGSPDSDETTFNRAEFRGERVSFFHAKFQSTTTSFSEAKFHSERVAFANSQFHSEVTSFIQAEFCAEETTFTQARFLGELMSFDNPRAWEAVYFDWDDPTSSTQKPDSVVPQDWPPTPTLG
ncbi:pentapeptide repeat-containing protein (plasmid) [Rhodococcoides fascians]|uniref:pentapeptide repeat-containing protein n=1 Tax=Rhodococcoides fascians TaxID=1828 RepID=UPI00389B1DD5